MLRNRTYGFLSFCLFFIVLFCSLGTWQLHRYHAKQVLMKTYEERLHALPKPFELLSGNIEDFQFQPVVVQGEWTHTFSMFIQQMHQGQPGFEVITPLRVMSSQKWLLVDRGWIPKAKDRSIPSFMPISGKLQLLGYIKLVDEHRFMLGKNIMDANVKPWVMQKIDIDELRKLTKHDFYPFMLRLDPEESYGFVRDWAISVTLPERHLLYAFQWFALAIIVLVGYCVFIYSERSNNDDQASE
jgi:surfeit locus 1 family protein